MMYARGQGTSQDSVAALTWLSLAATQNAPTADRILYEKERKELMDQMTAEQVVKANRRVLEWLRSQQ
jgi:TPR repeat protein